MRNSANNKTSGALRWFTKIAQSPPIQPNKPLKNGTELIVLKKYKDF